MSNRNEEVILFVEGNWNSDVRDALDVTIARKSMRNRGIERDVRQFLLGVIRGRTMTPEQWGDLLNIGTSEVEEMQDDAKDFWDWLFDNEPLPPTGGSAGVITPPHS